VCGGNLVVVVFIVFLFCLSNGFHSTSMQHHSSSLNLLVPTNFYQAAIDICASHQLSRRFSKPQIFYGVLFNGESDLLFVMLQELGNIVDGFIIVEAEITFTGAPKELQYPKIQHRFRKWEHLMHVVYLNAGDFNNINSAAEYQAQAWQREKITRDAIIPTALSLSMDPSRDIIIFGDADELVRKSIIFRVRDCDQSLPIKLRMREYEFSLRWLKEESNNKVVAATVEQVSARGAWEFRQDWGMKSLLNTGWNCGYCMPVEYTIGKLQAFSHTEFGIPPFTTVEYLLRCINDGTQVFNNRSRLTYINDSNLDMPTWVLNNPSHPSARPFIWHWNATGPVPVHYTHA
jgi:beta-1,4-mannosyl-glycoprotein beta-1,4-N-acetylglucosaminyltransferase